MLFSAESPAGYWRCSPTDWNSLTRRACICRCHVILDDRLLDVVSEGGAGRHRYRRSALVHRQALARQRPVVATAPPSNRCLGAQSMCCMPAIGMCRRKFGCLSISSPVHWKRYHWRARRKALLKTQRGMKLTPSLRTPQVLLTKTDDRVCYPLAYEEKAPSDIYQCRQRRTL